ncbi:hypothetical protein [uncultured Erythrobacter sp.]|uniref:hypothetical protein n=1 Tax=uncultured Erythrobacter sp. TaxID=263913 RepID=UPI0026270459|nr:hypothetical protein [uncultured Erythrobacter sp.]
MSRLAARLKYRILRSPAASLVKSARKVSMGRILAERIALTEQLPDGPEIEAHANALAANGFARLDGLIDPRALADLEQAAAIRIAGGDGVPSASPDGTSNKAFWSRPLDADLIDGKMPHDSAFTRFALQPALLGFLARSLGTLPLLDYVLLTVSRPVSGELSQSQLWHRDHDDVRTIKVFVYLTDVSSQADGPFTFLPGPQSDLAGQPLRSHAPDDWLMARADASDLEQMIAPKLSAFAVETSRCLHMGSRVLAGHSRALFTATFTTAPRIFAGANRFVDASEESELVRAVLGQALV